MRCLLLSSCLLLLSCSSSYKMLKPAVGEASCVAKFRPLITTVVYNTNVNVAGNHLSGLLIIKHMPDSSLRLVFTNEAGFRFFDFEFSATGNFIVHSIIKKMNKKAVIRTLRKDFQLVLMNMLTEEKVQVKQAGQERYTIFADGKDRYYYITDTACTKLQRMERGSKRRKILEAVALNVQAGVPDSIGIKHTNFNFDIGLKRIRNYADQ